MELGGDRFVRDSISSSGIDHSQATQGNSEGKKEGWSSNIRVAQDLGRSRAGLGW